MNAPLCHLVFHVTPFQCAIEIVTPVSAQIAHASGGNHPTVGIVPIAILKGTGTAYELIQAVLLRICINSLKKQFVYSPTVCITTSP